MQQDLFILTGLSHKKLSFFNAIINWSKSSITGASKGLGLALVKKLLAAGYNVAAHRPSAAALQTAVGKHNEGQFLPLEVDLTDAQSIENSIKKAHEHFGALDVVVNNAAYGIGGSAEELSLEEIRQIFEVNVFAVLFANTVFPSTSTSFCFTNKKHLNL